MVMNTSYQICLQNVETDYLEQVSPTWCPRAPGRPQGCRSPAGLF